MFVIFVEFIGSPGFKPEHGVSGVCLLHFCFATQTYGIPSSPKPFYMQHGLALCDQDD